MPDRVVLDTGVIFAIYFKILSSWQQLRRSKYLS